MKRNRILFCILWVLSVVGISFYGGPVSYGFFALLTLIPIFSFGYLLCVMFFFRIYQELDSKNLVANHTVPFFFKLMNEYFFGFASIRVRFFSSFSTISGLDDGIEYELLPKTGITKQTDLVCKYRGEYEVGIKQVEMQDFLRLFRLSHHNKETLRVMVRPDLVTLEELHGVETLDALARDSVARQTEPDVLVRRFEAGDDLRHVNWKASARSGELLTRKFVGEEREGISILVSTWRCSEDPLRHLPAENKLLEAVLALAFFFAKRKIPVRTYIGAKETSQHTLSELGEFENYYSMIAGVEFREDAKEADFLAILASQRELFASKTAFLVLQEWTQEAEGMVRLLSENHVQAVVYLISEELPERVSGFGISRASLIWVKPDADLREVM